MNEVALQSGMPDKLSYAKALAESGLLPESYRRQPANVLWAVEYGEMLGLAPMAAITGIHVISGKPTASASLISALVRRAGHRLRVTGDGERAVAEIVRSDDPDFTFRSEWTLERAQVAGLTGKGTWKSYPAAMLKARAITEVARDACEEALSGVHYTPEELGAEVDGDGDPVRVDIMEPRYQSPPSASPDTGAEPGPDRIRQLLDGATTVDEVRGLWRQAKNEPWFNADLQAKLTAKANELADPAQDPQSAEAADDVVDAELVDDEPEPVISEPAVTKPQLTKIGALFTDIGWTNRADQIRATQAVTARPELTSRRELTKQDASALIEVLTWCAGQEDPTIALTDLVAQATSGEAA